jgi:hypothetical protein
VDQLFVDGKRDGVSIDVEVKVFYLCLEYKRLFGSGFV